GFAESYASYMKEPQFAPVRGMSLSVISRDIEKLAGALMTEVDTDASRDLVYWAAALTTTCQALVEDTSGDPARAAALQQGLTSLAQRARSLAFAMDFGFLMEPEKRLLSIGWRVDLGKADDSCYDLLASECRLASFFAIAKGDLPNDHWFRLGRPVTVVRYTGALLSWSGSMFEYLMPLLVMKERAGSVLHQSDEAAVMAQIDDVRGTSRPWGVSEAAMNARDGEMTYQYYAFGSARLALKRGRSKDIVIAPYASFLAAMIFPRLAVRNLLQLDGLGALGPHGYYDAVDMTADRLPDGETHVVVRTVMAHHQGMCIVAVANVVMQGIHRERFHGDAVVQAAELLLQEKTPREIVPVTTGRKVGTAGLAEAQSDQNAQTVVDDPAHSERAIGLLSNGRYRRMITARGAGWSHVGDMAVTRWRPDPTCEVDGSFIFLRDTVNGRWWSASAAPKSLPGETVRTLFSEHKAEFLKTVGTIETNMEVIVATEADAEGTRLTIRNKGPDTRNIEVTTYGEIVLDAEAADRTHPAFSKMFVQTRISPDRTTITATRNQREPDRPQLHLAHMMSATVSMRGMQAETDRRAFLGRGRVLAEAQAFDPGATLTGAEGFTMDPCFALRRSLRIPPGKEVVLTIWTIVAPDEVALKDAVDHYRNPATWDHEARLSWTRSQIALRRSASNLQEIAVFRDVARHLLFPDLRLGVPDGERRSVSGPQSELWPLGLSGDLPIIVLRIDTETDLGIARQSLRLMEYLRGKGVRADLVLLNEHVTSYAQDLQNALEVIVDQASRLVSSQTGQSVHLMRRDMVPPGTLQNLLATAQIVLHARNGTWSEQLNRLSRTALLTQRPLPRTLLLMPPVALPGGPRLEFPAEVLEFANGYGGFADKGRTYVTRLRHGEATPHPWINVIARDGFGFHVPAEGGGYTWAVNSRDYQISPWSNDPVQNRPGEGIVLRDRKSGRTATPFAALSDDPSAIYEARHMPGQSQFRCWSRWLDIEAVQELSPQGPAKVTRLTVHNRSDQSLELDAIAWVDLVLGNNRAATGPQTRIRFDVAMGALCAENLWTDAYAGQMTALVADRPLTGLRASRQGLADPNTGRIASARWADWPEGDAMTETWGDPCLAVKTALIVPAGARVQVSFALAVAPPAALPGLIAKVFTVADVKPAGEDWDAILATLQVETPDRAFDIMVNTWLPYQALSCRIKARSAFYQASGAYGFRDQLQDTAAMILHNPALARAQILAAAGRQFIEGDVQHWWLPDTGAGVRTMISDDVVWLGHSAARYVALTGDRAILDEAVPYLTGAALTEGVHDAFYMPGRSEVTETLYDHCARALDLAVARTGPNGIPLILGGDWNDGMNRVGIQGVGESTWLGWFLCQTIAEFAALAEARGDGARAAVWRAHRESVATALDATFWDGRWYRRGTFDDGTPLGSDGALACRIDSIAQSWASISGAGQPERAAAGMDQALAQLKDDHLGIMRLFTPPFVSGKTGPDPGYIASYPPGVRENGGQYTHAAAWMVYALAQSGRGNDAFALFHSLNPISHALDRESADRYRVEPYVVAADIYGEGSKAGRGGWTWYTGAAGWLHRAAVEGILGLVLSQGKVTVTPNLPDHWPGYVATLRRDGGVMQIRVARDKGRITVEIDGIRQDPAAA
ncbi:MAG: protein ndvB, partial [Candidatus Saccharibacteria bacterium]|nr:protein ndvB [Pseudorhodobacter sp.]